MKLTERQTSILHRVAMGDTHKEIADKMQRTKDTIDEHVGVICKKLGAKNQTHAVALAYQLHIFPVDP